MNKIWTLALAASLALGIGAEAVKPVHTGVDPAWAFQTRWEGKDTTKSEYTIDWTEYLDKYRHDDKVNQLIFVRQTDDNARAVLQLYVKDKNAWTIALECPAVIGPAGLGKSAEGDMKSPYGEYELPIACGIKPNPGTKMKYVHLTRIKVDPKLTGGKYLDEMEDLISVSPQFNYCLLVAYNLEHVEGKGGGIFLHCRAANPYTAGCIAVSEADMVYILKHVEEGVKIVLGRSAYT